MYYYNFQGHKYRIILGSGIDWWDISNDTVHRWCVETNSWVPSDIPAHRVRSFGDPIPTKYLGPKS